ncbi:MAG TPA: hypothetical protein VJ829_02650 [Candidatus Binatia bacterium]|nr:hypothetical protein [Candidatus Binatia bacterium]
MSTASRKLRLRSRRAASFVDLARSANGLTGHVRPARALALCAGHFPDVPLLPGAALVGLMAELSGDRAVVAEYRDVPVNAAAHRGHVRFEARVERRLAGFWRWRCEARGADDRVLLSSRVTVAAER